MPLYEYRCQAGHVTELLRPASVSSQRCSCGLDSQRRSVYRTAQIGGEQTLPGRDFLEASEMIADQHQSFERREGVEAPPPPLYRMAKAKAERMLKQGAQSSADLH
jgi:hypothetical protein